MTVSVALTVPADAVFPGQNRLLAPDQSGEFERIVPFTAGGTTTLWVTGSDHERTPSELTSHPSIEYIDCIDRHEDTSLYELSLVDDLGPVVTAIEGAEAMVPRAETVDESMLLTLRFRSHEELQSFVDELRTADVSYEIAWKGNADVSHDGGVEQLTHRQRQTLWLAYERGYFDIPRRTTMTELAEELDVSSQAVSERLRRALKSYLATSLSQG
ncbi:helix-turn-helix domain-containing protein [Haloarchaeobius sp. DFWS5]|uniref:helix-turn-helix domain-containing protein n=1 Tax=Haloarchaeobius sp. DFWS5 TaxID=3446114 RepID=UPI003EBDB652